ncbi:hypothetical protein FW796_10760 [Pseudomonas sp. 910_21]
MKSGAAPEGAVPAAVGSRLAGEGVLKGAARLQGLFAGKPAPTEGGGWLKQNAAIARGVFVSAA